MRISDCGKWMPAVLAFAIVTTPRLASGARSHESKTNESTIVATATTKPEDSSEVAGENPNSAKESDPAVPAAVPQATPVKAEAPGVTFGFDERSRFEGYNNADFNDAKHVRLNQIRRRVRRYADVNF